MAGITFEQVTAAIETLNSRGERVTVASIRGELGRGSMSTVLKHLQTWRAAQGASSPDRPLEEQERDYSALCRAADELIRNTLAQVERNAASAAMESAETIKGLSAEAEEAAARLAELEDQLARQAEERGKLTGQVEALQAELQKARGEAAELRTENRKLFEECATAKAEAAAAGRALDDLRRFVASLNQTPNSAKPSAAE